MVQGSKTQKLDVSVFSALSFFRCREPHISRTIEVPLRGVGVINESHHDRSLVWIDGLAVQMAAAREFVQAIERGDTPPPLVPPSPAGGGTEVLCVSPASISHGPSRILDVLGIASALERLARNSPLSSCPECGTPVTLLLRPRDLCALLQERHAQQAVRVAFESPSPALRDWAESLGFGVEGTLDAGFRAAVDSCRVDQAFSSRIEPLLRSAWKIPQLSVAVTSSSGESRFAPHGFCERCRTHLSPRHAPRLRALIQRGDASTLGDFPERAINVGGLTLADLLSASMDSFLPSPLLEPLLPAGLQRRMKTLGLSRYALSNRTVEMPSEDVALLALAAGLGENPSEALAIIDVPHGIISQERSPAVQAMIESFAETGAAVILGGPLTHAAHCRDTAAPAPARGKQLATLRLAGNQNIGSLEFTAHQGFCPLPPAVSAEVLRHLRAGSAAESGDASTRPGVVCPDGYALRLLQPFRSSLQSRATVVEALDLFEPLAKLVVASIDAKALGVVAKGLSLRARKGRGFACSACGGLGIILAPAPPAPRPAAQPCESCGGARFVAPANSLLFRGRTLGEILDADFAEMRELLRVLPKSGPALALMAHLDLTHLSLGMPLALLSYSERRRLELLLAALAGKPSRPLITFVDSPYAGLSERHAVAAQSLMESPTLAPHTAWICCA